MAVLDIVLQEEYDRSKRMKTAMERELNTLPTGYLSKKIIKNKEYYYLQKRVGNKIKGTYIPYDKVQQMKDLLDKRKRLEDSIRELEANMKKIERVL